jgi:hypothetical protein
MIYSCTVTIPEKPIFGEGAIRGLKGFLDKTQLESARKHLRLSMD